MKIVLLAVLLLSLPAGMMHHRINKRTHSHDPEARQAAPDFQRDISRGQMGF